MAVFQRLCRRWPLLGSRELGSDVLSIGQGHALMLATQFLHTTCHSRCQHNTNSWDKNCPKICWFPKPLQCMFLGEKYVMLPLWNSQVFRLNMLTSFEVWNTVIFKVIWHSTCTFQITLENYSLHQDRMIFLTRWALGDVAVIFKLIIQNSSLGTHSEIDLRWMPQNFTHDKSSLVQVMVWCHQAASRYLNHCWASLWCHMASLGQNDIED